MAQPAPGVSCKRLCLDRGGRRRRTPAWVQVTAACGAIAASPQPSAAFMWSGTQVWQGMSRSITGDHFSADAQLPAPQTLQHWPHQETGQRMRGTGTALEATAWRGPQMLWGGGRRVKPGDEVPINIERTSSNSRRISGSVVINRPIEDVWLILTDYDRLAEYVPNLTQSKRVPHPQGGVRLFQEGAQKIVGFDFRASLVMDMEEQFGDPENRMAQRKIKFKLSDSQLFTNFDGEWRMQFNSRQVNRAGNGEDRYTYSTKLFYMVYVRPKGPVPVLALEWQISEEVPNNLRAVKRTAESMPQSYFDSRRLEEAKKLKALEGSPAIVVGGEPGQIPPPSLLGIGRPRVNGAAPGSQKKPASGRDDWEDDETLETYIKKIQAANARQ